MQSQGEGGLKERSIKVGGRWTGRRNRLEKNVVELVLRGLRNGSEQTKQLVVEIKRRNHCVCPSEGREE